MIITSGRLKGRALASLGKEPWLRPTSDKAREAIMDMLRAVLAGARFIDLCAGTGAMGIEALSNGASAATLVDNNPKSVRLIRRNVVLMKLEGQCTVVPEDAQHFAASLTGGEFDVLFADPPFDSGLQHHLLETLSEHLRQESNGCIIIMEHAVRQPLDDCFEGTEIVLRRYKEKRYGDIAVSFYRSENRTGTREMTADV